MSKLNLWQDLEWVDCIIDTPGQPPRDHEWRTTIAVRLARPPTSRCVETLIRASTSAK